MSNAISSALQRNPTYEGWCDDSHREGFREELARQIRSEAQRYVAPVSEPDLCGAIRRISEAVSQRWGKYLTNGRLKYGTAKKAFNLYLKFLWRLGKATTPPHCPIDRTVLQASGINDAWTQRDSERQHLEWINRISLRAKALSLAEWEYGLWLQNATRSKPCRR
jgi:hypothetical protein